MPRPIADEMAADLDADLARGARPTAPPPRRCSGSGASDPRAFAAAWATERGIIPRRRAHGIRRPRLLTVILLLVGGFVVLVAVGVVAFVAVSGNSSGPRSTVTTIAPSLAPGALIGTAVEGARVAPSNTALVPGRRTILRQRPRSITITFVNTSTQTVAAAHLTVEIDRHTYTFTTSRMVPEQPQADPHRAAGRSAAQVHDPRDHPSRAR